MITWDEVKDKSAKHGINLPTTQAAWYYSFRNTKSKTLHLFYIYFLHLLPALLVDTACLCIGKPPRFVAEFIKIIL